MNIEFASNNVLPNKGNMILLATTDGHLGPITEELNKKSQRAIKRAIDLAGERFKRGAVELICPAGLAFDRLLVFGLDDQSACQPHDLETLGGKIATRLSALGVKEAHLVVEALPGLKVTTAEAATSIALGLRLRHYRFNKYRTAAEEDPETPTNGIARLTVLVDDHDEAAQTWTTKAAIAAGVEHGRDLVTEPANVLTPASFAEHCQNLSDEVGVDVTILGQAELEDLGMRALLGVAQGSVNEPYLVCMSWQGGRKGEPPVALVGKGVCFDTGGISLKPAAGMEEMKWDMGGAAAVFGAMKAIAGRKAKANVVAVLGLVENMPSGTAQRPGDVVTAMSGTTIEVINTDAEGRLVLADALHYTKDQFKPKLLIDVATLTGAVIIALGHEQAGLFASDDTLAAHLIAAGEAVGERVWRLPTGGDYAKHIKSDIADIKNTGRAREAGATAGAVFLQRFVGDTPWAHIDIAGVAWSKRELPLAAKGATGFGVRLLDRFVADHHED